MLRASESLEKEKPLLLRKNMPSKTDGKNSKYTDTHTPNIKASWEALWTLSGWGDQEEWVSTSEPELPGPSCITLVGAGWCLSPSSRDLSLASYELGYKPQVTHLHTVRFILSSYCMCVLSCFSRV